VNTTETLRRDFVEKPPCGDWFVGCVRKISPAFDAQRFEQEVCEKAGGPVSCCVIGGKLAVAIAMSRPGQFVLSADSRRITAVFGELHRSSLAALATVPEITANLARELDGSWAMLRFDADRDEAVIVTDRLNSRRVFSSVAGETHWFASSLGRHPCRGGQLDPVAVGWYLTHGAIYGLRTPYEAIRVVPPSTLLRIGSDRTTTDRYWTPSFSRAPGETADPRRLQADLGELLVDAVRCRTSGAGPLFVSLSAGYDAAGIAGVLAERLRQPDVRCFSYARGSAKKGSDEFISAETAKRLGYAHEVLTSYCGEYPSWLEANARSASAMAGLCDEVDAWATLASQMHGPPATILVGDECLGWTDYALRQPVDTLRAAQIQGGPHLASARQVLAPRVSAVAFEGVESDISAMLADAPRFDDLHDLKDYFYISQRAPNYILPWRQNFASRTGNVRFPLLDARVLDFMATVPASLRRQKALYRRTISSLCPITFSLPRATSASYHIDHAAEFAAVGATLFPLRSHALAAMTSPELQSVAERAVREASGRPQGRSLYKAIVGVIKHTAFGDMLRKAQPAPPVRNPSMAELLARLFCLDRALVATGSQ
jgi:hypothetical protein